MAKTSGHGNPLWTRDETILALDLYLDSGRKALEKHDPRVIELSEFLNRAPFHSHAKKNASFRNPDGVAFKLQNLRQVDTGKGLDNVSKVDKAVIKEFGGDPLRTKQTSDLIRSAIAEGVRLPEDNGEDEGEEFAEGKLLTRQHRGRERNRKVRRELLKSRAKKGPLACDMCEATSPTACPEYAEAMFEAHHLVPLSEAQEKTTRLSDMALLCANCHRLIHKAISTEKRWLTIEDARALVFD